MEKDEIIKLISKDFSYSEEELLEWDWIEVEANPELSNNIFFDGNYVFFANDKVVWY